MIDSDKREALFAAAAAIVDRKSARAFEDAVFDAGMNWHPDDTFADMIDLKTKELRFTPAEAETLDRAADQMRAHMPGDEVYDYGMEVLKSLEDRELLDELGIQGAFIGGRYVPVDAEGEPAFALAIPTLLERESIAFEAASPDAGYVVTDQSVGVWENPDMGPCMEWAFAIAQLDEEGKAIETATSSTRSSSMFLARVKELIGRE